MNKNSLKTEREQAPVEESTFQWKVPVKGRNLPELLAVPTKKTALPVDQYRALVKWRVAQMLEGADQEMMEQVTETQVEILEPEYLVEAPFLEEGEPAHRVAYRLLHRSRVGLMLNLLEGKGGKIKMVPITAEQRKAVAEIPAQEWADGFSRLVAELA